MFAGLPGIGVGTLFFVLTALWMPFREVWLTLYGRSSRRRWRTVAVQAVFALGIVSSVAVGEIALHSIMGQVAPGAVGPTRMLNTTIAAGSPESSIFSAPMTASLLMLGGVLLAVEMLRLTHKWRASKSRERRTLEAGL
jgi:hypothetical protein